MALSREDFPEKNYLLISGSVSGHNGSIAIQYVTEGSRYTSRLPSEQGLPARARQAGRAGDPRPPGVVHAARLVDECPVVPEPSPRARLTAAARMTEFEFISENAQIEWARDFVDSLPVGSRPERLAGARARGLAGGGFGGPAGRATSRSRGPGGPATSWTPRRGLRVSGPAGRRATASAKAARALGPPGRAPRRGARRRATRRAAGRAEGARLRRSARAPSGRP